MGTKRAWRGFVKTIGIDIKVNGWYRSSVYEVFQLRINHYLEGTYFWEILKSCNIKKNKGVRVELLRLLNGGVYEGDKNNNNIGRYFNGCYIYATK